MRRLLIAVLGIILGWTGEVVGQETIRGEDGRNRFFIVDKAGADVFGSAEATRPERGRNVELGDFLFALDRTDGRIHVCRVSGGDVIDEVGWMSSEDLLEQRTGALTVGEAIQQGLEVVRYDLEGSFNSSNALPLRVVTQPERRTVLRGKPGTPDGEDEAPSVASWRWYYAFDREVKGGRTWLLLGVRSTVLNGETHDDTEESGPREFLRGWAPLDEMTIWATNLALELNTDPDAVTERLEGEDRATVYASQHLQARPLWQEEHEELWGPNGQARPDLAGSVALDPVGLGPHFPRLVLIQRAENNLQVASAASTKPGVSPAEINRIRRSVSEAAKSIRKADIVFVIDATGSMAKAMRETIGVLRRLADRLRELVEQGEPIEIVLPGGREEVISTALDLRVSVIGFQDMNDGRRRGYNVQTKVTLRDVVNDAYDIEAAFRELIGDTQLPNAGTEALHDGLREAMASRYWREDTVYRVVVLMTDEEGDTRDLQGVVAAMPLFREETLRIAPTMGPQIEAMPELEHKRVRTKLYSAFLGKEAKWRVFRANVEGASTEMFRLVNFNDRADGAGLLEAVEDVLLEQQVAIQTNVAAFTSLLQPRRDGSAFDMPGGLTELAIRDAMRRANLSLEDIESLNAVAYFEGYVRDAAAIVPGNPDAGKGEREGHWRLRVLVPWDGAEAMRQALSGAARGLRIALDTDLAEILGTAGRRELVASVILRVIDQVTGVDRYAGREQGQQSLAEDVSALLLAVRNDQPISNRRFSGILALPGSLPIRSDGLLGLTIGELFDQPENWFESQRQRLDDLAEGWRRIMESQSIPESPSGVLSAPSRPKYWFSEGLAGTQAERTAYVPFAYMP